MATKKEPAVKYRVLRDFGDHLAGDLIDLAPDAAADLLRDGMIVAEES